MPELGGVGKGGKRGPGFKGRFMVDTVRGVPRVRKWPRARGPAGHGSSIERVEWFRQAIWACKWWSADMQADMRAATAGTPLMPRDMQVMVMSGRAFSLGMVDGRTIYPYVAVSGVSESLDALAQSPGDLLCRGPNVWEPISSGLIGHILTSNGPGLKASFKPMASTGAKGGWSGFTGIPSTNADNQAFATKAHGITPRKKITIDAFTALLSSTVANQQFKCQVATGNLTTGQVTAVVGTTDIVTLPTTGAQWVRFPFTTPIELLAGTAYLLAIVNQTGPGTSGVGVTGIGLGFFNCPINLTRTQWRYNTVGLSAGQTASQTSANGFYIICPEGSDS